MFTCFKRNDKREIKVAQLAGSVAEHSAYHHGEVRQKFSPMLKLVPIWYKVVKETCTSNADGPHYISCSIIHPTHIHFSKV